MDKFGHGRIPIERLIREAQMRPNRRKYKSARPKKRKECELPRGERPCPYITCKYHLYFDEDVDGSIIINFKGLKAEDLHKLDETCVLDAADHNGLSLEEVGKRMNLTRERVRQMEFEILEKIRASGDMDIWEHFVCVDPEHHSVEAEGWAPSEIPGRRELGIGLQKLCEKVKGNK